VDAAKTGHDQRPEELVMHDPGDKLHVAGRHRLHEDERL
jgi:hypothetical protein